MKNTRGEMLPLHSKKPNEADAYLQSVFIKVGLYAIGAIVLLLIFGPMGFLFFLGGMGLNKLIDDHFRNQAEILRRLRERK